MKIPKKIIYNVYNLDGKFKGEYERDIKSADDYDKVIEVFEREPDFYEVVNVIYDDDEPVLNE